MGISVPFTASMGYPQQFAEIVTLCDLGNTVTTPIASNGIRRFCVRGTNRSSSLLHSPVFSAPLVLRHSLPSGAVCCLVSLPCARNHILRTPRNCLTKTIHMIHGAGTTPCRGYRIPTGKAASGSARPPPLCAENTFSGTGFRKHCLSFSHPFPAVSGIQSPALPIPARRGCSFD